MTHFTVLVRYEGDIAQVENQVEEMLKPYDENTQVERYKHYLLKERLRRMCEHYGIKPMSPSGVPIGDKVRITPEQIKCILKST